MAKSETILSVLLILAMLSVVSLGTFAFLNDVEMVGQNVITAGTLDLTVDGVNEPNIVPMFVTDMKPLGSSGAHKWTLKNVGSIAGVVSIEFSSLINNDNGLTEPEMAAGDTTGGDADGKGGGELGAYLEYRLMYGTTQCYVGSKKLTSLAGQTVEGKSTPWVLEPNKEVTVSLSLELPSDVGNIVQSDSVEFSITFRLDQVV